MKIELAQPFAANGKVDEFDVKQMKKALNRLGYYQPYEKVGITGIADMGVFNALKKFQKDRGLTATGSAKPDDETVRAINKEASKTPEGQYIWRTVEDEKVRKGHAEFNRTIRDWSDDPDPGEEFNCRCWAEPVNTAVGLNQELISQVNDSEKWTSLEFLKHFFFGGGNEVTLAGSGYLGDVISKAEEVMYQRLEDQIADKMRAIKNGTLIYRTENSYPELREVKWVFGGGTIKTITSGQVTQNGNQISIDAEVQYMYSDEFSDVASIRQLFIGPHNLSDLSPNWYKALGVTISEIAFGQMYPITGSWKTKLSGSIILNEK